MDNETPPGSAKISDGGGHYGGSSGEQSPLQSRAEFFPDGSWNLIIGLNRGACARAGAQYGPNPEAFGAVEAEWNSRTAVSTTLGEALDFLRQCHRRAPFLFFNGNTFADFGRRVVAAYLAEMPASRLREATSAIAHYIAGVLDRESMATIIDELCRSAEMKVGDKVKTLRGSMRGVISKVLEDGRVAVRPLGGGMEFYALPESLLTDD